MDPTKTILNIFKITVATNITIRYILYISRDNKVSAKPETKKLKYLSETNYNGWLIRQTESGFSVWTTDGEHLYRGFELSPTLDVAKQSCDDTDAEYECQVNDPPCRDLSYDTVDSGDDSDTRFDTEY